MNFATHGKLDAAAMYRRHLTEDSPARHLEAEQVAEGLSVFAVLIQEGLDTLPEWRTARDEGARFFLRRGDDGLPELVLRRPCGPVVASVSGRDLALWVAKFAQTPANLAEALLAPMLDARPEVLAQTITARRESKDEWSLDPLPGEDD